MLHFFPNGPYRRSGSRRYRPMTVTAEEFIRRFLQHVLPAGFQKVRHFGFAHPRHKVDLEWLKMLVTVTLNEVYVLIVAAHYGSVIALLVQTAGAIWNVSVSFCRVTGRS